MHGSRGFAGELFSRVASDVMYSVDTGVSFALHMVAFVRFIDSRHKRGSVALASDYADKATKNSTDYAPQLDVSSAIRAMGGHHEALRTRCEAVVSSLAVFRSASNEIEELFREFGSLAIDSQENNKALKNTLNSLNKEIEQNQELKDRIEHIQQNFSKVENQMDVLASAKSVSDMRAAALEMQLRANQAELKDNIARLREVEQELSGKKTDCATAEEEVERLALRIKSQDKAYNDACEDRRVVREKLLFETEERLKLSKHNEELSAALVASNRVILDLQSELDETKAKLAEVEATSHKSEANVHKANADLSRLQDLLRTTQTQLESERGAASMKLAGMNSRLKLTEQLLEQAREESRRVLDERLVFDDTTRRLKIAETAAVELRHELKKEQLKIIELDQLRSNLIERADEIQALAYEKQLLNQQAAERINMMQERFVTMEETYKAEISKLSDQLKKISDDILAERNSRAFIEGALQTARLDRTQLQNKIIQLKKGEGNKLTQTMADVEEDHLREGELLNLQLVSTDDNVTKLRQP
eukprot:gene15279-15430_t